MGHGTVLAGRLFNLLLFIVEGDQHIGQGLYYFSHSRVKNKVTG